jgi:hypothetical protein
MKRCLGALAASILLALSAGVSVASANGLEPVPGVPLGQTNESDQAQIQVVPVAPQVNVQNVNVATSGEVEQGDANNANTGQASQQENTQSSSAPASAPAQSNDSDQSQIQVVPIAPQVNVQNVNVATHDDVQQGDANNANTGQASQQENTASTGGSKRPAPTCGSCSGKSSGGWQKNDSDQSQIQVVPIAPQVNVQNVNVLTFDDVEQGDANNANTGQANQQSNSSGGGHSKPSCHSSCEQPKPCGCEPKPEPRPCDCKPKPEPCRCEPRPEPKPCECQQPKPCGCQPAPKPCGCQPAPKPCYCQPAPKPCHCQPAPKPAPKHCGCKPAPHTCGCASKSGQKNVSSQKQIQIVPIAPQVNVQNLNVLTFGDVEQGDANNANTGQANQQSNTVKALSPKGPSTKPDNKPPVMTV